MTDSSWTGDDDQPRTNPYYNHGAGKRMDNEGRYGCLPLLLVGAFVVLAVLLVGVQVGKAVAG